MFIYISIYTCDADAVIYSDEKLYIYYMYIYCTNTYYIENMKENSFIKNKKKKTISISSYPLILTIFEKYIFKIEEC